MADFYTSIEVRVLVKNVENETRARLAASLAVAKIPECLDLPSMQGVTIAYRGQDVIACTKED